MENRENKTMCVTYELSTSGARALFINKGVYKAPSERWVDIYFDPLELSEDERRILFDNTSEGLHINQLIYDTTYVGNITDIHKFIEIIKS